MRQYRGMTDNLLSESVTTNTLDDSETELKRESELIGDNKSEPMVT